MYMIIQHAFKCSLCGTTHLALNGCTLGGRESHVNESAPINEDFGSYQESDEKIYLLSIMSRTILVHCVVSMIKLINSQTKLSIVQIGASLPTGGEVEE